MPRASLIAFLLPLLSYPLCAEEFTIRDIRVQGLKRISPGVVFSELPVTVGDRVDAAQSSLWINALYRTGYFDDVSVERRRDVLRVVVLERPGIASITLVGNKSVSDEQLLSELAKVGVATGRVFDRYLLERLTKELVGQYQQLGKLNARVDTEIAQLPDSQIGITIIVDEGEVSRIREFQLIGNRKIGNEELFENIESAPYRWYRFWSSASNYSRVKLSGDLEALSAIYLNRGYLDFEVSETRVSLSPDKRSIYIRVRVEEGEQYRIGDVSLSCRLALDRTRLESQITLREGDIFSRADTLHSSEAIEGQLKNIGYANVKVNVVPYKNPEDDTVDVAFVVDPGPKTYVRRINFRGNDGTNEEVFRRELRQLEGAEYSAGKLELSRRRLQRLPYVESAEVTSEPVANKQDQMDVNIDLVETQSGNLRLGAAFSEEEGAVLSVGVNQDNFLGTGNRVGFVFNNSKANTNYTFSFLDPFHTINGISRLWSASYRSIDNSERDINNTNTDDLRLRLSYGIPLSENDTLQLGGFFQDIEISPGSNIGTSLGDYYADQCGFTERLTLDSEGREVLVRDSIDDCSFTNLVPNVGFDYDTRDRSLFTTEGSKITSSLQVFIPLDGLAYYKADYSHRRYLPLNENADYVFALHGRVSYADAYGDTTGVPPYDRFFAGGSRSVRGYSGNSLGPRDDNDDPLGGDLRVLFNADLFLPSDFLYDRRRLRVSTFVDYGNVFGEAGDFELKEMRGAYGFQVNWLTPVGGLSFNFSLPFGDKTGDDTESFQFDLGTFF